MLVGGLIATESPEHNLTTTVSRDRTCANDVYPVRFPLMQAESLYVRIFQSNSNSTETVLSFLESSSVTSSSAVFKINDNLLVD